MKNIIFLDKKYKCVSFIVHYKGLTLNKECNSKENSLAPCRMVDRRNIIIFVLGTNVCFRLFLWIEKNVNNFNWYVAENHFKLLFINDHFVNILSTICTSSTKAWIICKIIVLFPSYNKLFYTAPPVRRLDDWTPFITQVQMKSKGCMLYMYEIMLLFGAVLEPSWAWFVYNSVIYCLNCLCYRSTCI